MNVRVASLLIVSLSLLAGCRHAPVESGLPLARKEVAEPIPGYATQPDGQPRRDADGRCWRTAEWRPILAIEACDPAIVRERRARELALGLAAVASPSADAASAGSENAAAPETAAEASAAGPATAGTPDTPGPAAMAAPLSRPAVSAASSPDYVMKPVVLNTDAAFFFGKDRLTPAGRDAVENLAAYIKLWGIQDVTVEVTGHTDRIGNARDNQALSVRRAEAVRDVIVEAGVPADKVVARGVGSTQPVTKDGDCPNDIDRCELINCLAPDRRVEVGLKGQRKAPVR